MSQKIGQDVSSSTYWEARSKEYIEGVDGAYHRHRLDMVEKLIEDVHLKEARCLDVGCGEGVFAEYLLEEGALVHGIDISETMISSARLRLCDWKERASVSVGGIKELTEIDSKSVDIVFALNVLAYLSGEEEKEFYSNVTRILVPDGALVVTHSNELFDLFTLNQFTVDFFRQHFSVGDSICDITNLLQRPNEPNRKTFAIRENPLSYRHKLATYKLREIHQEFAHFHPLPPLLMPEKDPDDINAHEYLDTLRWPLGERWKLMFVCSMFGSRSIREITS